MLKNLVLRQKHIFIIKRRQYWKVYFQIVLNSYFEEHADYR